MDPKPNGGSDPFTAALLPQGHLCEIIQQEPFLNCIARYNINDLGIRVVLGARQRWNRRNRLVTRPSNHVMPRGQAWMLLLTAARKQGMTHERRPRGSPG
jgi:hypothetical protein